MIVKKTQEITLPTRIMRRIMITVSDGDGRVLSETNHKIGGIEVLTATVTMSDNRVHVS